MNTQPDRGPLNRRFFWDVDPETIDIEKHATFIIERLLERGDEAAITWLNSQYDTDTVRTVLKTSRRISPRSATFFALTLNVPKQEIRCLTPSYRKAHAQRWPH